MTKGTLRPFGLNGIKLQEDFYTMESWGSEGGFGMSISVGCTARVLDDEDLWAIHKQADEIQKIILGRTFNSKPETLAAAKKEREDILACFSQHTIFVEELPNGYCSEYCHKLFPWFQVTTSRGPIVIGWRKRVINIDWSESKIQQKAEQLFSAEQVTKFEKSIHAYGYVNAKKYIDTLLAT